MVGLTSRTDAGADLGAFGVDEAEAAQARIELDRRDEQAAARLDAIRRELDVDPPEGEGA